MTLKIEFGNITTYNVDVIVNAANRFLLGGGGVDGAIHKAAGRELYEECKSLGGCETGNAKITKGYNLKSKYVIHTVGPYFYNYEEIEAKKLLISCYKNSLKLALENNCKTIAFPLISSGIYGYPKEEALNIAVETINSFDVDLEVTLVLFESGLWNLARKKYPELIYNGRMEKDIKG